MNRNRQSFTKPHGLSGTAEQGPAITTDKGQAGTTEQGQASGAPSEMTEQGPAAGAPAGMPEQGPARNCTRKGVLRSTVRASAGLFLFSFGVYLTIQANIGAAPWDIFSLGLSHTFGIKYGTASIGVSLTLLIINVILKEPIGLGMFLDSFIVGKAVDLFNRIDLVPACQNHALSLFLMIAGLFIEGISQYFYMSAALGCGPRDTFLVAMSKRFRRVPIGAISICILAVVTLAGWRLGGPVGIGTLICAFLTGPIMQLDFRFVRFDAAEVTHQNIIRTGKVLSGKAGTAK